MIPTIIQPLYLNNDNIHIHIYVYISTFPSQQPQITIFTSQISKMSNSENHLFVQPIQPSTTQLDDDPWDDAQWNHTFDYIFPKQNSLPPEEYIHEDYVHRYKRTQQDEDEIGWEYMDRNLTIYNDDWNYDCADLWEGKKSPEYDWDWTRIR